MRPVNLREGSLESPARAKVCTNKIALQTCNQSACAHYPLLMFEIEHPINVHGNWGSGLSDFAPLCWLQQGPWLESAINFPSFACCIVMEVFSFPAGDSDSGHNKRRLCTGPAGVLTALHYLQCPSE